MRLTTCKSQARDAPALTRSISCGQDIHYNYSRWLAPWFCCLANSYGVEAWKTLSMFSSLVCLQHACGRRYGKPPPDPCLSRQTRVPCLNDRDKAHRGWMAMQLQPRSIMHCRSYHTLWMPMSTNTSNVENCRISNCKDKGLH